MGEPGKIGRDSGVAAEDLVSAPRIGDVTGVPGKQTLIQSTQVGVKWIDHGAVCEGKDQSTAGCFLGDTQREHLIIDFKDRVQTAKTNYKLALEELRVDELMKKEDDLNWVISLALEVFGGYFIGKAVKALTSVKASGLARLAEGEAQSFLSGVYAEPTRKMRAEQLLFSVSDKTIETKTKAVLDPAKKSAAGAVKMAKNQQDESDKAVVLSYLAQLRSACDVGFRDFANAALGNANDAELVVLWKGMDETLHGVDAYKAALAAKLKRFKDSGVTEIGRTNRHDRETGTAAVHVDTRVVWVRDMSGGRSLWYQSQESDYDPSVLGPGDPGAEMFFPEEAAAPRAFGPSRPRGAANLDRRVPAEFQEAALARSEQKWGPAPTVDDPTVEYYRGVGLDRYRPKIPPAQAPGRAPSVPAVASATGPSGGGQAAPAAAPKLQLDDKPKVSRGTDDPMADLDAAGF